MDTSKYTLYQKQEIDEGIKAGLDVSVYANPRFIAIQMREIRLGLMHQVPVECYASPEYDWFQMEEIRKGLERNIDVRKYASPEIPFDRMRQIRKGLECGIDLSAGQKYPVGVLRELRLAYCDGIDIRQYIKQGYEEEQLKQIRLAKGKGLDIDPYLSPALRGPSIGEIALGLERELDVSLYAKEEMNWQQMREIRLGMEMRLDVSVYDNVLYSWQQMREIRLGMMEELSVECYSSLMYTSKEMCKKRLQLLNDLRKKEAEHHETKKKTYDTFSLLIDAQQMEAFILVPEVSKKIKKQRILDALKEKGVVYGIDTEALEELEREGAKKNLVVVARGTKPQDGKDGWYEYFFDTNVKKTPKLLEDGSVDYQNAKWFEMVDEEQKVAYYHSAEEGIQGMRVTGESVAAEKGRELLPLKVKGVTLLPDGKTYVAAMAGKIDLRGNNLIITGMVVYDNVTKATGNIDFNGSVHIRGTIGDGVHVKATKDIIVDGYIEAAILEAGGDIILAKGNNGKGKGSIKAGNDVRGKFFENANIVAGGDMEANYCLNSTVYVDGGIKIDGRVGKLAGGTIQAGRGIRTYNLGNQAGLMTKVTVGREQAYFKRKKNVEEQISAAEKELFLLRNAYKEFQKRFPAETRNSIPMFLKVEDSVYTKENELKQLEKEKEQIEYEAANGKTERIIVDGKLYSGVCVYIDGTRWNSTEATDVTIRKIEDVIVLYKNV